MARLPIKRQIMSKNRSLGKPLFHFFFFKFFQFPASFSYWLLLLLTKTTSVHTRNDVLLIVN
jgi:hypothetical protein